MGNVFELMVLFTNGLFCSAHISECLAMNVDGRMNYSFKINIWKRSTLQLYLVKRLVGNFELSFQIDEMN